jgi:hypothetical protein
MIRRWDEEMERRERRCLIPFVASAYMAKEEKMLGKLCGGRDIFFGFTKWM